MLPMTRAGEGDLLPEEDMHAAEQRTNRLRSAMRLAGGNVQVARKANIPLSTLKRYIAGYDMKVPALVTLANACGVTLEWLAVGSGPMRQVDAPPAERPKPTVTEAVVQYRSGDDLFATLDMEQLGIAALAAQARFAAKQAQPTPRELGMVTALLYDQVAQREREAAEQAPSETPNTESAT